MKIDDVNGFEFVEGLSGKSGFWVCGKGNGGDFSAVRVYMRRRPPLLSPAPSAAAEGEKEWRSAFPCNAVRSPFYNVNSFVITGIVVPFFLIATFFLELKMPKSGISWPLVMLFSSICSVGFLDLFFSNLPQMMEFSREGVSFFVNGRLSRKISAASLRQIYFVKSAFRKGGETFDAFRLIAVFEEQGGPDAGRLSSLTLLENVPFYEAALFLEKESERMMGLQDIPVPGEAKRRESGSGPEGSIDSASVELRNSLRSCGSLEEECVIASISGSGDEERLEVRVRTQPLGPWSDFVGWSRWKFFKFVWIFPPVFLAVVFALFSFLVFPDDCGFSSRTLIDAVSAVLVLLFMGVIIAVVMRKRTDFSILFSKDSVVVSRASRPYFEKVIRRGEISWIFCSENELAPGSPPVYDVRLLDSEGRTMSLVSGMRSFETAKFIDANAERIVGIAVGRAGSDD